MSRRRTDRREAHDDLIRRAELAAYESHGLAPRCRHLGVDTGYGPADVRIVEFGAPGAGIPVVLLHGIGSVNVIAAPLIRELDGRHVIALDWPGHGLSGPCVLPAGASLRTHARAVVESLLDALDLTVVDLVGHSLGAQISLYASLDLDHRVRRLVLLGAPGAALEGVQPITLMKMLATPGVGPAILSLPLSTASFRRTSDRMLGSDAIAAAGPEVEAAAHLFAARRSNARSIASFFRTLLKRGRVRTGVALASEELGRVRQPVLMAWGDLDIFQTPISAALSLASLRDVRLVRLPAGGHAPWLQDPKTVSASLLTHLA